MVETSQQKAVSGLSEHVSRVMWRLYEPIHSVVYFHPNATASYSEAGLKGGWMSYFASRSAALGTPSAEVVQAAFYHFAPAMVKRAIPDAWSLASPREILKVRHEIAVDAIQNGVEGLVSKTQFDRIASRLYDIAITLPISGRVLYAAHLTVNWGDSAAARLFGAATLLREHRGDTHNAALAAHGIDGVQSHLLQIAAGAVTHDLIFPTRGWSVETWNEGFEKLLSAGILSTYSTPRQPILTDLGRDIKNQIESQTDSNSNPWFSLEGSRLANIRTDLKEISAAVRSYVGFPANNPIGV